jgi:phosphoesterase RecJ-like protein
MPDPTASAKPILASRIAQASSLLLLAHRSPDGDALGSMLALARGARQAGKTAALALDLPIPKHYQALLAGETFVTPETFPAEATRADLIVVVDTSSRSQLGPFVDALAAVREKVVVIDHHATRDDISDCLWADTTAAAAGLMVMELLDALGWPVTPDIAGPLALAITTDTGWLRFSNTDGRCLRAMATLVEAGVRPDELYAEIYQTDRPQRIKLLARVLENLELHCNDQLALMMLRKSDFADTGAHEEETENLVNEAMRIATVQAAAILVENDDEIRASLRSRSDLDVAKIARTFHGGGHAKAAGFRVATKENESDLETVREDVIAAVRTALT